MKRPNGRGTESATVDAYRCCADLIRYEKKGKGKEKKMREEDKKEKKKEEKRKKRERRKSAGREAQAVDAYFRGSVR